MDTTSTTAPTNGAQASFTLLPALPASIPPPKFHLFQPVRYNDRPGIISGMEYLDLTTALLMGAGSWGGWEYTVNYVQVPLLPTDKPPDRFKPCECVAEEDLEPEQAIGRTYQETLT